MSPELLALVERARHYRMTPEERRQQAVSFAYGNGHIEDPRITRDGVGRAYDLIRRGEAEISHYVVPTNNHDAA